MKKILAILIASVLTLSLATAIITAYEAPGDDGIINVAYAPTDIILIDGEISEGEWPDENSVTLTSDNLITWYAEQYEGAVVFNAAWNENGLYIAAAIVDGISTFVSSGLGARLQISLNPGDIIDSSSQGLFFSFSPIANTDTLSFYRHNWQVVGDQKDATSEEGYEGKYTFDDENSIWYMEAIIPWSMISTTDRTDGVSGGVALDAFDPTEEGAFITATICYIPCNGETVLATGRTCKDGNPNDWTVASYDITLALKAAEVTPYDPGEDSDKTDDSSIDTNLVTEKDSDTAEFEDSSESDVSSDNADVSSDAEPEKDTEEIIVPDDFDGDINDDGSTDNKDVVTLFRYVSSGASSATDAKYDITGDGNVDNKDVVALFRYVSKLSAR